LLENFPLNYFQTFMFRKSAFTSKREINSSITNPAMQNPQGGPQNDLNPMTAQHTNAGGGPVMKHNATPQLNTTGPNANQAHVHHTRAQDQIRQHGNQSMVCP
jgi:hypothetical protein